MRIKNLKTKDNLKELDVSFSSGENIIFVVEPYDETSDELPFEEERFLGLINCLFFNDSYTYAKNFLQNMLVECTLEKDDVDYTFGVIGSVAKKRENGYVHMRNLLNWYCNGPEKELQRENGGWWGAQLSYEPQEYFYPYALQDFATYHKETCADSPADFAYGEELDWLNFQAYCNKRKVDVEKKLQKLIGNFSEIKINEHLSVGLDKQKEYVLFFDGRIVPEETLNEREELLVNFCGWINNLNVLTDLCEFVAESGVFPVFIDSVFDGALSEYKDVLIKELRKTGRQVFIISHKHDEEMEKLCDKVIEIK